MKDKIYRAVPIEDFNANPEEDHVVINGFSEKLIAYLGSDGLWYKSSGSGQILSNLTHVLEAVSLPSEEEIEQKAEKIYPIKTYPGNKPYSVRNHKHRAFIEGAKFAFNVIIGK